MAFDQLLMIADVFDPDATESLSGPPVPFGAAAFSERDWSYSGTVDRQYFSETGFVSSPGSTLANRGFIPRLINSFSYELSLFSGTEPNGESSNSFGIIRIANGDGELDDILDHNWDGRLIRIFAGGQKSAAGQLIDGYNLLFKGTSDGIEWDHSSIVIRLRTKQSFFVNNVHKTFYAGTGGKEGGEELENKGKPLCFGEVFNVPTVAIDTSNLIYQIHDGQIQSVDGVRDKGVALTLDTSVGTGGDVATYADLVSATITASQYATCKADGMIGLGSSPDGQITVDAKGDATGTYINTIGKIVRRIVTTRLQDENLEDPGEIDDVAFTQMETDQAAKIGYFVGTESKAVNAVMNELMGSVAGFWFFRPNGKLSVGILKEPYGVTGTTTVRYLQAPFGLEAFGNEYDTLTYSGIADLSVGKVNVSVQGMTRVGPPPSWRRRLGYRKNWSVQSADALADGVSDADRQIYSEPSRFVVDEDASVLSRHKLASEVEKQTFFVNKADASVEADRQQSLFGVRRDVYSFPAKLPDVDGDTTFIPQPGWVINMKDFGRFNFSSIEQGTIIGFRTQQRRESITLEVWK